MQPASAVELYPTCCREEVATMHTGRCYAMRGTVLPTASALHGESCCCTTSFLALLVVVQQHM